MIVVFLSSFFIHKIYFNVLIFRNVILSGDKSKNSSDLVNVSHN